MADEITTGQDDEGTEQPFLGTWATKEAAEEGLANMQAMIDKQGNEVGGLRKQVEMAQELISKQKEPEAQSPQAPKDYSKDIASVQKQLLQLDPVNSNYQSELLGLMEQANNLTAMAQHEKTLGAATKMFKEELDNRDIQATHKEFYGKNPDFNTPEMQARVNERMSQDTTGMLDSLSAYREIQRDDAMSRVADLEKENEEYKRIASLTKGVDSTGKVITKGQSPQQKDRPPKTKGADRDKGMQAALDALSSV